MEIEPTTLVYQDNALPNQASQPGRSFTTLKNCQMQLHTFLGAAKYHSSFGVLKQFSYIKTILS